MEKAKNFLLKHPELLEYPLYVQYHDAGHQTFERAQIFIDFGVDFHLFGVFVAPDYSTKEKKIYMICK